MDTTISANPTIAARLWQATGPVYEIYEDITLIKNIIFVDFGISCATEQVVHSFVTSRLDMGNSLLFGLPQDQIARL